MGEVARPTLASNRTARRFPDAAWIVAGQSTLTNDLLVGAFHENGGRAKVVRPSEVSDVACTGYVVLGRLDVRRTLDGVEDGIRELRRVERRGLMVLNSAPSLLARHDKLQTILRLGRLEANGGYIVLEINGAVDFTHEYSFAGGDIFDEAARSVVEAGSAPDVGAATLEA